MVDAKIRKSMIVMTKPGESSGPPRSLAVMTVTLFRDRANKFSFKSTQERRVVPIKPAKRARDVRSMEREVRRRRCQQKLPRQSYKQIKSTNRWTYPVTESGWLTPSPAR